MPGGRYRLLRASETQPIPQHLTLNYAGLFKIQQIQNPFPLRPVSFSRVAAYLECPSCALEKMRKRRRPEPKRFTEVHQPGLFPSNGPDPRLVGTLLHEAVNLLHAQNGPLESEYQARLLTSPEALARFLRHDFLRVLQVTGKLHLAMFFDEIRTQEKTLLASVLRPLFSYQRELQRTGATVFAPAERFQFKLLSTSNTFAGHRDWGGYVGLVGEFDQIRLHDRGDGRKRPAIMEFKKGLGKSMSWDRPAAGEVSSESEISMKDDASQEPRLAHALQLILYWLAFQTRWDILERVQETRGQIIDLAMEVQQDLDLILYNLQDGTHYQLESTDMQEALLAVTNCLFFVDWAMKSGYAWQSPEHECGKTSLLNEVPDPLIQVGSGSLEASQCYRLARAALQRFSETVRWHRLSSEHVH